jgi:hypothetical protein
MALAMADEIVPIDDEDVAAGGSWMTIATLAQKRRITKASAWRLVTRRGWERLKGNDGAVRVYVPRGQQQSQADVSRDDPIDSPNDGPTDTAPDMGAIVSAKDETIANLREHVADLRAALGKAEGHAQSAEAQVDELREELRQWLTAGWWQRRRLRRAVQGRWAAPTGGVAG